MPSPRRALCLRSGGRGGGRAPRRGWPSGRRKGRLQDVRIFGLSGGVVDVVGAAYGGGGTVAVRLERCRRVRQAFFFQVTTTRTEYLPVLT